MRDKNTNNIKTGLLWRNSDQCSFLQTVAELEGVTEGINPETDEKEFPKAQEMNDVTVEKRPPEVLYSINSIYGRIPVYKKNDNLLRKYMCFLVFLSEMVVSSA